MAVITYRPDIDGLRALAVLSVVLYHISPTLLPGGFLGVDIFFVISGYLISLIIFREKASGTFSFSGFYLRRARRLFPSLGLVLATTLIIGYFSLFADEYKQLGQHASQAIIFLLNFQLMDEAGYFDVASHFKPLLHLWSLSIEEQFYLLWPLFLYWVFRLRLQLALIILLLGIGSYVYSIYLLETNPDALYFHPLARFWELLLGTALAYWHDKYGMNQLPGWLDNHSTRNVFSLVGLALIFWAFWAFNSAKPHPGPLTLIPLLGVVAIIASGGAAMVNRFLAIRLVVFIGLISYPLYLWHWPLLSFVRIMESGTPPEWLLWVVAGFSVILAWLTYVLVERPIRYGISIRRAVGSMTAIMIVLFVAARGVVVEDGFPGRGSLLYMKEAEAQMKREPRQDDSCISLFEPDSAPVYCRQHNPGKNMIAIVGDSHAHVLFPGVAELAAAKGYGTLLLANSGCPPLLGAVTGRNAKEKDTCMNNIENILSKINNDPRIFDVILATRGPIYITGEGYGAAEASYAHPPIASYRLSPMISDNSPERAFLGGLERTVARLIKDGKTVTYFLQPPELGVPARNCLGRPLTLFSKQECTVALSEYEQRMQVYRKLVGSVQREIGSFKVVDPKPLLCDQGTCSGKIDGVLLYADDDHLSIKGSKYVAPLIMTALGH